MIKQCCVEDPSDPALVRTGGLPEDLHAPAGHGCEEARAQVAGRVHGVATVEPHGHGDGHDDEAYGQRLHALRGSDVPPVDDGQDAHHEHPGPDDLEGSGLGLGLWYGLVTTFNFQKCDFIYIPETGRAIVVTTDTWTNRLGLVLVAF